MKLLKEIQNALPDNSIDEIAKKVGKSRKTVFNVLDGVHKNYPIVDVSLDKIEEHGWYLIDLAKRGRKEYPKREEQKQNQTYTQIHVRV